MKGAFFITARLGSKRLVAKHLEKINNQPALSILLQRVGLAINLINCKEVLFAVVSGNKEDNCALESIRENLHVFYGDDDNIPFRHLQAAKHYNIDFIVSVDGDDPFISPKAMAAVFGALSNGASYVKTEGLPLGMNAWGYTVKFLESSLQNISSTVLETGWGRIFDEKQLSVLKIANLFEPRIRATLDYPEDLAFFRQLFVANADVIKLDDQQLVKLIIDQKIFLLNQSRIEEYWSNFQKEVSKENDDELQ